MAKSWQDETCEHCEYRVGPSCRRFPPMTGMASYPEVLRVDPLDKEKKNLLVKLACAEYKKGE